MGNYISHETKIKGGKGVGKRYRPWHKVGERISRTTSDGQKKTRAIGIASKDMCEAFNGTFKRHYVSETVRIIQQFRMNRYKNGSMSTINLPLIQH